MMVSNRRAVATFAEFASFLLFILLITAEVKVRSKSRPDRPHHLGLPLRQGEPLKDLHPHVCEKILDPLHFLPCVFPRLG